MERDKQQYYIRVASDYRWRDHWTLNIQSPERRRHRRRLRKGPKQDLWCIMCTGALLMYAAVAIIPATSSLSQTRPIFHGVR